MSISNIEKINDIFKLPIFYNDKKMGLNKSIIDDLELVKTVDPSCNPMYENAFQPKTCFGAKLMEQIPTYYTTDQQFLEDSKTLLKTYTPYVEEDSSSSNIDFNEILSIWDEIKNDTGFKEKYHYIDWPMWEFLNKSDGFLQIMSIYNLASPVLSLFVPIIILIIPFFVIKAKGMQISILEYTDILKQIASNHAVGKLFTQFNNVKTDEKVYLLLSAAFYAFSIYQNILTCYRFHQNMFKIHSHLNIIKNYISKTETSMKNLLTFTTPLSSYNTFNDNLTTRLAVLSDFKVLLERITPYKLSTSKIGELGHVLKCFYDVYSNDSYNDAFLYSFGFNGYIDSIEGLINNISCGKINFSKFTNKKKKSLFKNAYYPALINKNPVKNTYKFKKSMIITGPNASGKTTILKSALINVVMTQQFGCGFYDSAILCPFKFIHCYLNIPDTSGRDSLFQAEARRCKNILDIIHTNEKDTHFCVFDELYSGTNPDEAVMSALAFMNYLVKYKSINCILTTHFIQLCNELEKNKYIKNYHMNTTKPKQNQQNDFNYNYLLKKGISTVRGGIKVLSDMDYPKEIIENTMNEL